MIFCFHSSPNLGGNLERMVIKVAKASGLEFELIRLAELDISSCRGCVRCAKTRRCIQNDSFSCIYEKLEAASGLIVGGVNYNGRVNSLAHTFLERLFPLYHQKPMLRDIPVAVVAVGGENPEKASGDITKYLQEIYFCNVIGTALFKSDTPPCFSCGLGPQCPVGMPALHWPENEFQAFTTVKKNMFQQYEDNEDAVEACKRVGQALSISIRGDCKKPRSGGGYYLSI